VNFVVYDNATGRVIMTGQCDKADLPALADTGQTVMQADKYYVPERAVVSASTVIEDL
jgi:hypothetical protein